MDAAVHGAADADREPRDRGYGSTPDPGVPRVFAFRPAGAHGRGRGSGADSARAGGERVSGTEFHRDDRGAGEEERGGDGVTAATPRGMADRSVVAADFDCAASNSSDGRD